MDAFFSFLGTFVFFVAFINGAVGFVVLLLKLISMEKIKTLRGQNNALLARVHELERMLEFQKQFIHSQNVQTPVSAAQKQSAPVPRDAYQDYAFVQDDLVIVGVTFDNDDRTSRQEILKKCYVGMPIQLKRTPMKKYPNAIGVFTQFGQIGNISEDDNEDIAESMDAGLPIEGARIKKITGGTRDKPTLGCVIEFGWYMTD